ncbi:MAG: flavodoxin-dependent (E)-4-hydroxy-3-methylbut-2-enyl-diphosphate synthase [Candidatus Cloacimonetes bacterium]|nr:flavodoxin-dependent (E)-4-hydroxy-3-methylbut-2-enyl-diphosphate synthase [Candidatus Cloacimonadota bacterium]
MKRKMTRVIKLGNILIGGENPITIQSMTNTDTRDTKATIGQIKSLEKAGCEIIRIAIPDMEAAHSISTIQKEIKIPLIADIHFDYKLAIESVNQGIDGLRLNPGNIGSYSNVLKVVDVVRDKKIPIRIGVNSGSISKEKLKKYGHTAIALVESALEHVQILEKANYQELKISVKASDVPMMIEAYRILSEKVEYPLHLGVTEAGTEFSGSIISAVGIGTLLSEGIGDTIRVSLTESPEKELVVAKEILKALDLRKGLKLISCPTCGRTEINLIKIAKEVEIRVQEFAEKNITIAVMGCIVNGPGEAREADYGIAGGKNEGLIFKKGKIIKKVPENELISTLIKMIKQDLDDKN